MKIKISTTEDENITALKEQDCPDEFTNLKETVDFINRYGEPQKTYILHITLDTDTNTVPDNLHFQKDMELRLEHENFMTLKGIITIDPTAQISFRGIGVTNLQVNRNRIYEPDFVPLIMIKRETPKTTTPSPKDMSIPLTTTTTTSSSEHETASNLDELAITTPRYHERSPTAPIDIDELINNALKGTIYVSTNGTDSNNGLTPETSKRTIQNAINTTPAKGNIIIDAGSYDENITINKSLCLHGANALINGSQKGSCITCTAGTIDINGITVISGKSEYGGGIRNHANLNLNNVKIVLNTATNGGGIYNTGILSLTDMTLLSNRAEQGGGIYTTNVVSIHESNIFENNATQEGGGIYTKSGKLIMQNSNIYSNSARYGGGIYSNSQLDLICTEISFNIAESKGGGVYNMLNAKFNTVQFQKNGTGKEGDGGGIYNIGSIIIEDSVTFTSNICGHNGGAIYNNTNGSITGNYTIFMGNEGFNGGAIYNQNIIKLTDANYIGNTARNYGGALFISRNSLMMICPSQGNKVLFDQNLAYGKGGAIYAEGEIQMTNIEKGKNYPEFTAKSKS